jgi:A/G-specific adenine glycosylase
MLPSSPWGDEAPNGKAVHLHAPLKADWRKLPGLVEHTFTHFHLELSVYRVEVEADGVLKRNASPERCRWLKLRELSGAALPSLMRKVIAHALNKHALPQKKRA